MDCIAGPIRMIDLAGVYRDIRFSVRTLARKPAFLVVAVCMIAVGAGVNNIIFNLISRIVLPPLPFSEPERLVALWEVKPSAKDTRRHVVFPANFEQWRARAQSFSELAAYAYSSDIAFDTQNTGRPERIRGAAVSSNLFSLLGVKAEIGRTFSPDEENPAGPEPAVVSHNYWLRRFGGAGDAIGSTIFLNSKPYLVIGVLPPDFLLLPAADVLITKPTRVYEAMNVGFIIYYSVGVVGRLKPGTSPRQAQAEMEALERNLQETMPRSQKGTVVRLAPLREEIYGAIGKSLLILFISSAFVLLIACSNLAILLLARGSSRLPEFGLRLCVGAGIGQVLRQVIIESMLLSGAGVFGGLVLGTLCSQVILTTVRGFVPRIDGPSWNWRMLAFAVGIAAVAGLFSALAPAMQAARLNLSEAIKTDGRTASPGRGMASCMPFLVTAEIALTLVLLGGAGILMENFIRVSTADLGFDESHILLAKMTVTNRVASDPDQRLSLVSEIERRLSALPGVRACGISDALPFRGNYTQMPFTAGADRGEGTTIRAAVSPGFFAAMGIRIVKGRGITDLDRKDSPRVTVIEEEIANQYFPGGAAIGRSLIMDRQTWTVVGIVVHIRDSRVGVPAQLQTYIPYVQDTMPSPTIELVLKTFNEPASLRLALEKSVWSINASQPVTDIVPISTLIGGALLERRVYLLFVGAFAAIALALSAVGVYGVASYSAGRRTREMGIRIALGATKFHLMRWVMAEVTWPGAAGLIFGLIGYALLSRSLPALLVDVRSENPAMLLPAIVLLVSIVLLAGYLPARRTLRKDPLLALRSQ